MAAGKKPPGRPMARAGKWLIINESAVIPEWNAIDSRLEIKWEREWTRALLKNSFAFFSNIWVLDVINGDGFDACQMRAESAIT
jgi:hypothetical protein